MKLPQLFRWKVRATPPTSTDVVQPGVWPMGNPVPTPSHGYVHEPFAGAWQRNRECHGPAGIFSAVYACVQVIAGDIAKLPPRILQQHRDGSRSEYERHPAGRVVWTPNRYQTRVDFWGQFMASALFTGNTYVLLVRDQRNVIESMHILDPRKVRVLVGADGSIWYQTQQRQIVDAIGVEYIPAREIMHHRLLCLSHPLVGVTPIYAAAHAAATGLVIQQNSLDFFSNMSRASGVLTTPGSPGKELLARIKAEWDANFRGRHLGSTAVLSGGVKWEPLTINAVDAQLVEQLRWSVEDVARCFRVPMYMISDASKISYKNSEQLARNYYSQTLQYHLESIEARIDTAFELASDVFVEFDLDAMLRMELDVRMTAYREAINSGVMTINEARKKEMLPPKDGGDEPLVQKQYVPLSMLAELAKVETTPPPPNEPPPPDEEDDDTDEIEEVLADVEASAQLSQVIQQRAQQCLANQAA